MKVLLINPPSPFLLDQAVFPPLGLLYVAAALEEWDIETRIVDLGTGGMVGDYNTDLVGISGLTPHVPMLPEIIREVRRELPHVPVILGGPHFATVPADAFPLGADTVCSGDGEPAILTTLLHKARGTLSGTIDVNQWPKPARHLIDLHRYHYLIDGTPATPLLTARGCPYACAYCSRNPGTDHIRYVALDKVVEELDDIRRAGFGAVMLYDDELNLSTKRLGALCDLLHLKRLKWRGFVRSDLFTTLQAEMMKASGCVEVCCGVESGSDVILRTVNKQATVADATHAVQIAKSVGLRIKVFCMIGLPGETERTVEATRRWLLDNRPDDFDLCPFTPYPGSPIYAHPDYYDIRVEGSYWDHSYYYKGKPGEYRVMVSTSSLSFGRIAELRDRIDAEVREALK